MTAFLSPLLLGIGLGCAGGEAPEAKSPGSVGNKPKRGAVGEAAPQFGLNFHAFGEAPSGTYGPYIGARAGATALSVWVKPSDGAAAWVSQALDAKGIPQGNNHVLGAAPLELGLASVRPVGGAAKAGLLKERGFVLLFTERGASSERVQAISLEESGRLVSGPWVIADNAGPVLWLSAVSTQKETVALWASQSGSGADLYAKPLNDNLAHKAPAFVKNVRSWQALPFGDGVAVAWVAAGSAASANGPILLGFLDSSGALKGAPTLISQTASAELDLDLVVTRAGLVVGWSDRSEVEARVQLALVDPQGKILIKPQAELPSAGEQALVDLLAPEQGLGQAYVVWETPSAQSQGTRWLEIARLNAELKPERQARLRVDGPAEIIPELVATTRGVSALTLAALCKEGLPCEEPDLLPTFVQFDEQLNLIASEPLRNQNFSEGIHTAWGLSCPKERCFALAAESKVPARLFSIELFPTDNNEFLAAGQPWQLPEAPRMDSNQAVALTEPLSDVASLALGNGALVSWLTYFDPTTPYERRTTPAPDGRFEPVRAVLKVRGVSADGQPQQPEVISYRARSLGGVALSSAAGKDNEALLVWTALDAGVPQVFTTLLDSKGKKLRQSMLTRSPGEVSDVAVGKIDAEPGITPGWVVGWVDERHGDPEVYVARLGQNMLRIGPDRRVTNHAGAATGVQILARGAKTWVAWSEARDPGQPGVAEIYLSSLKSQTGELEQAAERPILSTRGHSHSPVLASASDGMVLAWLEEGEQPGVRVAKLDSAGKIVGEPLNIELPDAAEPSSLSIECQAELCRGVVSAARDQQSELYAFVVRAPGSLIRLRLLGQLSGPAAQAVSPNLLGNQLWFADQREGRGYLRLGRISW